MKRTFMKLHLWLSVPFGIIITLVCFSGAMLVFEKEVNEAANPELYTVEPNGRTALPVDEVAKRVAQTLPDSVEVTGVTVSSDAERTWQVSLSKPRRASVYVDQYTSEIKGKAERSAFFNVMFRLHRWLLDSMKPGGGVSVGKMVVGISTLMFVIILITGIIVWWPRSIRGLKQSLKISVNKGWRRFWNGLHVAGGMYALIFLLAMALTGLTWSFSWYRAGFYKVFGAELPQKGGGEKAEGKEKKGAHGERGDKKRGDRDGSNEMGEDRGQRGGKRHGDMADAGKKGNGRGKHGGKPDGKPFHGGQGGEAEGKPKADFTQWQAVYAELARRNPGFTTITVKDGKASVSNSTLGNSRAADSYEFDSKTGKITDFKPYAKAERGQKLRGWIFAVHTGSFGGLFTRILAFLAALLGASLPITGYYFWLKRICRKSSRQRS